MSHTSRNFVFAYILLVGLPLAGLVGVLRSGRTLKAPISIDGLWQLKVDPVVLAALPCGKALAENLDTTLAISQSGKNFTLSFANGPKSVASGALEGTAIEASIVPSIPWSAEAGCGDGRELSLVATVNQKDQPQSLLGHLSVNNCASCTAVEFRALRQTPSPKKGLH